MSASPYQFDDPLPQTWDHGMCYLVQTAYRDVSAAHQVYIWFRVLCTPAILGHLRHPSTKSHRKIRALAHKKLFEFYVTGRCFEARDLHKCMFGHDFKPSFDITIPTSTMTTSHIAWRGRAAIKSVLDQAFPNRASASTIN